MNAYLNVRFILRKVATLLTALAAIMAMHPIHLQAEESELSESTYVQIVRPILEKHCYECHGQAKQSSGLRLDIKRSAFSGGDGYGPSIIPGRADESPLVEMITASDLDHRMPPEGEGLSTSEIDALHRWIDSGAEWPEGVDRNELEDPLDHWSFQPLRRDFEHDSIDDFVAAKLVEHGLSRSAESPPIAWLRRATLDLTGLPPTPEEVQNFTDHLRLLDEGSGAGESSSDSEAAYASVVDGLLQSQRYGERWGQHWLDVVRYADTHGFEVNTERPNAWPYRDYVIRAFNSDTPYDQFIRQQIAGDAFGQDAATGFLVTASVLLPGQIGKDAASIRLARQDSLDEIVNNIGQTFLGLSVGCARCHHHKFAPISARDYYGMQALVAGVEYEDREMNDPESQSRRELSQQVRQQLDALEFQLESLSPLADPPGPVAAEQSTPETDALPGAETASQSGDRSAQSTPSQRPLRPAVGASPKNVDRFATRSATRLRFTILATNSLEPCLDELEVYDARGQNIALASSGTKLSMSGSILVPDRHDPAYLHDGRYGNESSWLGNETGKGWVELEFQQPFEVTRVVWSRDRQGLLEDRLPTEYRIELQCNGRWELVADSSDRRPHIAGMSRGPAYTTDGLCPEEVELVQELLAEKSELEKQWQELAAGQLVFAGRFRQPDSIHLLLRGDPEQPKEEVQPAVLSALGKIVLPPDASEQERRIALAEWIAEPANPLTARVMVNRIWQWHFGQGLVSTPSDFGKSGTPPTHPELLDWLAQKFIDSGWSVKHMHRLILLSQTYRQSSVIDPIASQIDGDVRWLWRYPSRRMEAESIRDSMLYVCGQLDGTMYGRGFDLFQQRGGLSGFQPVESLTENNRRRMIYAHKVRRESEAVFGAFDCPDAGQSTAVRRESTTPIQALNLLNSRFALECSSLLASRVEGLVGSDPSLQIQRAYLLALSRLPTQDEIRDATPVVSRHGLRVLCRALFNCNEFLFFP